MEPVNISLSEIELNLGIISVKFKVNEAQTVLQSLIDEMKVITSDLKIEEQDTLKKIMSKPSGSWLVSDLFSDFRRGSRGHETLRLLRDSQFIRPKGGGRWEAGKTIEIKSFGKVMWDKVGPDKLFHS